MPQYLNEPNLKIFASTKSWIEGDAVEQLRQTLLMPGMVYGVGLPDLHPGKGHAIGAAFVARDMIYPFLVGSDIGCGVGLWTTGIKAT
jgi:release factor H-coupled RctB family protein